MSTWAVACLLGALKFHVYASPVSSSISGLVPTTASNLSRSLTTLGTALPTCIQPRASTDPPAAQISSSLASASVVENSCNSTTDSVARVGAVQIVYYNSGAYYLNITRLALLHLPEVPASYCPQQFQNIIDTCVVQQSFWGGWITSYGVNWSVSNFDYPQNPLPLPIQCSVLAACSSLPTASTMSSQALNSGTNLTTTQGSSTESTTVAVGSMSTAVASNSVTLHTNGTLLPGVYPAKSTISTTLSQVGVSQSAATTTAAASSGVLTGAGGITQLTGPTTITPDYSITNAFPSGVSTTTLSASNGAVLVYSMQTFADLTTLTGGPILVQTSVTETESDGHHTMFIGGVWVGPGGRYWGPPGLPKVEGTGINLPKISPPCIWPFCSGRVTDDGGGGGDPGGDPPPAYDPDPDDPSTSATTSQSSLSSSVSTTTSISSSTSSSMSTSTISSPSLSSTASSSSSSTSSSSSYSINGTISLPDQGYVYTTMELSDAMSWSAAVQSRLIGLVIPTGPLWAPTDSAESAEQAHATDSLSFDIALPPASLVAEPNGTSQAVDESTSATQSNTSQTGLSLLPSTPTLARPTTSSVAVAPSSPALTTAAAPSSPASTTAAAPPPSPPPSPAPSLAIIIWRQDDCSDTSCESEARVFDIAAGAQSSVNPCTDGKVDYSYQFAASVANDNSDYTIAFGKFTTHNIKDVSYAGSNLHVGKLTGTGLPGGSVECEIPQPFATSCSSPHSLDADDQTPIAYCAW